MNGGEKIYQRPSKHFTINIWVHSSGCYSLSTVIINNLGMTVVDVKSKVI